MYTAINAGYTPYIFSYIIVLTGLSLVLVIWIFILNNKLNRSIAPLDEDLLLERLKSLIEILTDEKQKTVLKGLPQFNDLKPQAKKGSLTKPVEASLAKLDAAITNGNKEKAQLQNQLLKLKIELSSEINAMIKLKDAHSALEKTLAEKMALTPKDYTDHLTRLTKELETVQLGYETQCEEYESLISELKHKCELLSKTTEH